MGQNILCPLAVDSASDALPQQVGVRDAIREPPRRYLAAWVTGITMVVPPPRKVTLLSRLAPLFPATPTLKSPLPVPEAPEGMEIHQAFAETVQVQDGLEALTTTPALSVGLAENARVVFCTANVQTGVGGGTTHTSALFA